MAELMRGKDSNKAPNRRHVRRVPASGSKEHATWRANIASGIRAARSRRHAVGLMTVKEVATELALPVTAIKTLFPTIKANRRLYIRRSAVDRWLRETGAEPGEERIA